MPILVQMNEGKIKDKLEEKLRQQSILSKIRSLNNYLEAIIQKKIRLDLEIKRTRVQLTKLRSISTTEIRATAAREGFTNLPLDPREARILQENMAPEEFQILNELDREIDRAQELLEIYKDLPLYQE